MTTKIICLVIFQKCFSVLDPDSKNQKTSFFKRFCFVTSKRQALVISGETTAGLTPYLLEPEGLTPYPLEEDTSGLQPYLLHGLQPVLLSTLMETTTTLEPAPTLTTTLEPAPTLPPYNPAPSPPPFCKYCKCRTATASSTPPSFSGIYVVYLFCYNRIGLRM